jgi:pyridinium-3,5-bisthiocarboxylic acid mononucleotide nickel chelatase
VLRIFLGEEMTSAPADIIGLETNLDDVTGETLGFLMERLLDAGALDVFYTPIQMKKNRPGVLVRVLCAPPDEAVCTGIIFSETTALGVRRLLYARTTLPRSERTVETAFGPIRVKVSRWGDIERAEPEYEDCRRLAREHGVPLRQVYDAARQIKIVWREDVRLDDE